MKVIVITLLVFLLAGIPGVAVEKNKESSKYSPGLDKKKKGSGIIFFKTQKLKLLKEFYLHQIGCSLWLDQGACLIFRYGNLLFGFCEGKEADVEGTITFFYPDEEDVDQMYQKFKQRALSPPQKNLKFQIYHFYIHDPEGRSVEFQCFLHPVDWNF